jgi:hypothetical protein
VLVEMILEVRGGDIGMATFTKVLEAYARGSLVQPINANRQLIIGAVRGSLVR